MSSSAGNENVDAAIRVGVRALRQKIPQFAGIQRADTPKTMIASSFKQNPAWRRISVHPYEIPFHKEITHLIRSMVVLGEHIVNSAAREKVIDWRAVEAARSQGIGEGLELSRV